MSDYYRLYIDGACVSNPGGAGAAAWILRKAGKETKSGGRRLATCTNNEAEYAALIDGLKEVVRLKIDRIVIYTDSQLLERQVKGQWKCKAPHLQELLDSALKLLGQVENWWVTWIPRELNEDADMLAEVFLCSEK